MRTAIINGFPIILPNEVIHSDGFYVSYNNHDTKTYGSDTTALVLGQGLHFYILNGDHRNSYRLLINKGFEACLEYFKRNIEKKNKYSEDA